MNKNRRKINTEKINIKKEEVLHNECIHPESEKIDKKRQAKLDEYDYNRGVYNLSLSDAFKAAEKGHFVTNSYFSSDQSMHYWNGKFYYEDGAVVTKDFLEKQEFALKGGWAICISKHRVDTERLNKVHIDAKGMMLYTKAGYQQCVLK